jgi:hypothetical protein
VHALPHAPQFAESICRFVQTPEHNVCPVAHGDVHVPDEQLPPAKHACPHVPQLALSERTFASQPFVALRSQSAKPVPHAKAHVDDAQTAVAFAAAGQALPHAPQFAGSLRVSAQYARVEPPSAPPQSASIGPHVVAHEPIAHT